MQTAILTTLAAPAPRAAGATPNPAKGPAEAFTLDAPPTGGVPAESADALADPEVEVAAEEPAIARPEAESTEPQAKDGRPVADPEGVVARPGGGRDPEPDRSEFVPSDGRRDVSTQKARVPAPEGRAAPVRAEPVRAEPVRAEPGRAPAGARTGPSAPAPAPADDVIPSDDVDAQGDRPTRRRVDEGSPEATAPEEKPGPPAPAVAAPTRPETGRGDSVEVAASAGDAPRPPNAPRAASPRSEVVETAPGAATASRAEVVDRPAPAAPASRDASPTIGEGMRARPTPAVEPRSTGAAAPRAPSDATAPEPRPAAAGPPAPAEAAPAPPIPGGPAAAPEAVRLRPVMPARETEPARREDGGARRAALPERVPAFAETPAPTRPRPVEVAAPDVVPVATAPAEAVPQDAAPAEIELAATERGGASRGEGARAAQALQAPGPVPPAQIARQIAEAMPGRPGGPVELHLDPRELGTVRITLQSADGALTALVVAERPETAELMRRNADVLEAALREAGGRSVSVDVSGGGGDSERGEERPAGTPAAALAEAQVSAPVARAASRGLDLRL